jgi:hypothetical protein
MSIILPWDGVDCDGCGRKNLTGRFKCMICRDFGKIIAISSFYQLSIINYSDLCSDCVSDSKTYHPQHADSLQLYYSHKCDSCKRHLTSAEDWWRCSDCEDYGQFYFPRHNEVGLQRFFLKSKPQISVFDVSSRITTMALPNWGTSLHIR